MKKIIICLYKTIYKYKMDCENWLKDYLNGKYTDLSKLDKTPENLKILCEICNDETRDELDCLRGMMFSVGIGYDKDLTKAKEYFMKAIQHKNPIALYCMGYLYESKSKFKKAIEWYTKAAEEGNVDAMRSLGIVYMKNNDIPRAMEWYEKAKQNGDQSFPYIDIDGYKDINKSVKCLMIGANRGDVCAMIELAKIYMFNEEHKNIQLALYWLNKCNTDPIALHTLGVYYETIDIQKSIEYYEKATKKGNHISMNNLGYIYASKIKDIPKAIEWFTKSLEEVKDKPEDDGLAAFNLGYIYDTYDGYKDKQKALKYLCHAVTRDSHISKTALNKLNEIFSFE